MNELAVEEKYLLNVQQLKKYYQIRGAFGRLSRVKGYVKAVDNISFQLIAGETYGLVGESGCGKSTTGRSLLRLIEPSDGKVIYDGKDVSQLNSSELRKIRQNMQMVFQDPFSSLNPRKRIGKVIEEPLVIHGIGNKKERQEMAFEILEKVGLKPEHYYRYPHEFSGGQRQRIGLARALVLRPKLVILDEPVSALDVSIQSQILNLLDELQDEFDLTFLFIAHDISVVRHISDRIGVMYLGHIVEEAPTDHLFSKPLHPYTQALLSAVPRPTTDVVQELVSIEGELPSPLNPPSGCVFHTRCPHAMERCKLEVPIYKEVHEGHKVACHLYDEERK
ncbi:ABC transporter ATP-binding protein [Alkalihalobacillus sp. 1P02AB]|uniref:ABC transporter ATP-binding protein n=1 Tax=Alkalihalobacillus sp. 1P02AB TaxID=3132260 RepID=UPI0039A57332